MKSFICGPRGGVDGTDGALLIDETGVQGVSGLMTRGPESS